MKQRTSKNTEFISEDGLAMPVAVIMVLLVSVVGAGLLTFIVSDLEASGQVNRGQQAFGIADAGVAVAEQRISDVTDPTADGWSSGIAVSLPGYTGSTTVKIENLTGGVYKVTSTGNTSGGTAKRRVEAKFSKTSTGSSGLVLPAQFGTAGNIQINGNLNLKDQLMFAGGNIKMAGNKPTLTGAVGLFAGGNFDWVNYSGPDAPSADTAIVRDAFKNWKNGSKNPTPRPYPDSQTNVPLGIGAMGRISPDYQWSEACKTVSGIPNSGLPEWSPMRNDAGVRYFDKCSDRKFVENPTLSSQITFPFDTYRGADGQLYYGTDGTAQANVIAQLKVKAQANGTYFTPGASTTFLIAKPGFTGTANYRWPSDGGSLENTVIFVSFASNPSDTNLVKTQFENSCSAPFKGTIVVENGNFITESSMDALSGAVIVKKGSTGKGGVFESKGSCINGYVWADSGMKIQSNAPTFTTDLSKVPGFSLPGSTSVSRNTWREVYE